MFGHIMEYPFYFFAFGPGPYGGCQAGRTGGACRHCMLRDTADIVCSVTQQTCQLCHTADVSAVSQSRRVCCVTQQTCLLCHTVNMSAVSRNRHVCHVTQQTCLCDAADMSAVSHSRHVCCGNRLTCLLCDTAPVGETLWVVWGGGKGL